MARQDMSPEFHRRGAAIVEFAVVLPVFVLIVLGTIETTSMIFLQQSLKIAAYESARVALVPGSDQGNVEAAANAILSSRGVVAPSVSVTPANFENSPYGTAIGVEVTVSCNQNSLVAPWIYQGRQLTTKVSMMKES